MNNLKKILLVIFIQLAFTPTYAVELSKDNTDYNEMARTRSYPGGADEEDLKVKEDIIEPSVTLYKSNVDQDIVEELQKSKNENESR